MSRSYYTLVGRDVDTGIWGIVFGDYSRSVVVEERDDYRHYSDDYSALKILKTGDTQAEVDAAVAKLNGKRSTSSRPVELTGIPVVAGPGEPHACPHGRGFNCTICWS